MALSHGHGLLVVCPFLLAFGCSANEQDPDPRPDPSPEPGYAQDTTPPCDAPASWFEGPTTPFFDAASFPPLDKVTNCDFHLWTWQTFLALMSPADTSKPAGPMVFEGFAEPSDLFRPGGPSAGYPGSTVPQFLINQAGPGDHVLIDQAGQMVFYSVYLNQTYWDFAVKNELYELDKLQAIATDLDFPVGTLELKLSWRVAADEYRTYIEDQDQFYLIDAEVPEYELTSHNTVTVPDPEKTRKVRLALVGFHVAGVVEGHPEFIWGTFEHLANAPDGAGKNEPSTSGPFGGTADWSFYQDGTPTGQTNMVDSTAQLKPSNITRLDPWGGGKDPNVPNIIHLNQSVWSQLPDGRSLLKNYFESGAIWTNGSVPVNNGGFAPGDSQGRLIGSVHPEDTMAGIANTTMETFTQTQNCFYCHNGGEHTVQVLQPDGSQPATTVGGKNLNLSHFIVNYQAEQQLAQEGK